MPNIISLNFFIPELILSFTALMLIFSSLAEKLRGMADKIAIIGLIATLFFVFQQTSVGNPPIFWGMMILDKPAVFFKVIFTVTALLVVIFSSKSKELACHCESEGRSNPVETSGLLRANALAMTDGCEYYALLVGSVLGMNLLASASNILMIYLSLEFVSILSYILVGYVRGSVRSNEASLKYVLYGAVASGIFLYGASLYYGCTGTLDVGVASSGGGPAFGGDFSLRQLSQAKACYSLSGLFMLAGFLYKIAAVPMHAWCPDAYEGAPTPITAFLSVAPKAAGFAVLMRVSHVLGVQFSWPIVIAIISAATMTFGNLAAIPQTNVKRLLAYSSIAHAGYLLMGVACGTAKGNEAIYFYFVAYLVMNLGAFLVVQIVCHCERSEAIPRTQLQAGDCFGALRVPRNDNEDMAAFQGLSRRGPYGTILAIAMTIFLLSLTGVPPFFGFIGKFYIFSAVIEAKLYWLAFIGIANSVVSLYYYMRIVKTMFFETSTQKSLIHCESKRLTTSLFALSACTIFFGLSWQWLAKIVGSL